MNWGGTLSDSYVIHQHSYRTSLFGEKRHRNNHDNYVYPILITKFLVYRQMKASTKSHFSRGFWQGVRHSCSSNRLRSTVTSLWEKLFNWFSPSSGTGALAIFERSLQQNCKTAISFTYVLTYFLGKFCLLKRGFLWKSRGQISKHFCHF